MPRLELPDVTLVAVDMVCHELTILAVDECLKHAKFGGVKIFTNIDGLPHGICIGVHANIEQVLDFTVYQMPSFIKTSHVMFVQWDSWIIDPTMWRDEYLAYDYVGAPWWYTDGLNVGNSGFSLRSKALMEYIAAHKEEFPIKMPEDDLLCRTYRPRLPQFKWAPEALAHEFSFECSPPHATFGYHAMRNWPHVMERSALIERTRMAARNSHASKPDHLGQLLGAAPWLRQEIAA